MCKLPGFMRAPKIPAAAPMLIPASDNAEAMREADIEAALRRRRRGAAANILTGPSGIPGTRTASSRLGEVGA